MKTVASFSKPEEAHLLRSHLEGSGVEAFIRDDHTVTADWALSNAIGGVKVEVADENYDEARSIMTEFVPPKKPEVEGKKKHEFGRYVKLFLTAFIAIYGVLAWQSSPASSETYAVILMPTFLMAACVAGIGAVFDL